MLHRVKTNVHRAMVTYKDEYDSHASGLIQEAIQNAADANISGLPRKDWRFVCGKRLRLSLNMAFPEISDPKGICKDVSGLGRWDNGDVEVGLSSLDEFPYVIGLVRQALKKQTGTWGAGP